jgi:ABC-type transporter Mla MlaB component
MATKDERPGLLSKVALFVRNPTKDWSELDDLAKAPEPGYDKQAIKAMMERKRQNDFVRKREFDQLRKLRKRALDGVPGGDAQPSSFHTSWPSDHDGRANTLKKIDAIEAQMSTQWRGSQSDASSPVDAAAGGDDFDTTQANFPADKAAATPLEDVATIQMGPGGGTHALASEFGAPDLGLSTARTFAAVPGAVAIDPVLEQAAIRFASGDDWGAEQGLLSSMRAPGCLPAALQVWAAALLDLYRATGNRAGFDAVVLEFCATPGRVQPAWARLADWGATDAAPIDGPYSTGAPTWTCPELLNLAGMEDLRDVMSCHPMPWRIDWSSLTRIAPGAMPLLGGLFSSLCDEPVVLQFAGGQRLVQALRQMTPSGDRSVDAAWWITRLNALRSMQLQDDFELAALDYCITYELVPPSWVDARCNYSEFSALGLGGTAQHSPQSYAAPDPMQPGLRGEILGDATAGLAMMEMLHPPGQTLVVDCAGLLRVDFAAAGSILNWASGKHAQGLHVQFNQVHRLVAAFFNIVGIHEFATVVPRPV